jgi:hypothetical protein
MDKLVMGCRGASEVPEIEGAIRRELQSLDTGRAQGISAVKLLESIERLVEWSLS